MEMQAVDTNFQALLRGVVENPDDDAYRLVLADYIEEHGDGHRAAALRDLNGNLVATLRSWPQVVDFTGWSRMAVWWSRLCWPVELIGLIDFQVNCNTEGCNSDKVMYCRDTKKWICCSFHRNCISNPAWTVLDEEWLFNQAMMQFGFVEPPIPFADVPVIDIYQSSVDVPCYCDTGRLTACWAPSLTGRYERPMSNIVRLEGSMFVGDRGFQRRRMVIYHGTCHECRRRFICRSASSPMLRVLH